MRRLNVSIALVAALILPLAGLAAAGPAIASSAGSIYRECEVNGSITGHYSRAELQQALSHIPSEVAEYSDCQDLIQQAMLSASGPTHHGTGATAAAAGGGNGRGGGSGKSSGGGRAGKTPAHSTRKGKKTDAGSSGAVTLAGSGIRPGSTGAAASTRSLPAALLVVLILLALTAVSGGAVAVRRRVVARNGT